jgi:predicted MFS family arabinose efflux permease
MDERTEPNSRYGWYVVGVLIVAYTFSYVDRTILTLMVGPIRKSLGISDVQLSLLHGLAFAVFYTILGIPIGRLVDRRKRTVIIAGGIFFWSIMTGVCGLARNFGQMFAARIGVGVGEAALSPAAYSLLSDWFPDKQLVRALSLYQGAIYLGGGIATMAGGAMIAMVPPVSTPMTGPLEPWQVVFMIVGLPGVLVSLWMLTLREPARRGVDANAAMPTFGDVLRHMRVHARAYGGLILGLCLASLMWNGVAAWLPTHFIRKFGWTAPEVGLWYGATLTVCGTAGIVSGGYVAGHLRERGIGDANILICVISACLALPFGIAAALASNAGASLALFACYLFAGAMPYGGGAAAFQEITPNRMRGQVSAIYLFWLNLAGIGLGPTFVAWMSQTMFGGDMGISAAMAADVAIAAPLGAFVLLATRSAYRRAQDERSIIAA